MATPGCINPAVQHYNYYYSGYFACLTTEEAKLMCIHAFILSAFHRLQYSRFQLPGSNGRKKRQTPDPDSQFECTSIDSCGNFTFTEDEIAMCDNDLSCLIDLAVTGDERIAIATRESGEKIQRVQAIQSEYQQSPCSMSKRMATL